MDREPDETSNQLANKIFEQLPIKAAYEDLVQPTAREIGGFTEDLAKTLRLIAFPLKITATFKERLYAFIEKSFQKVPEEQRICPAPQIIGPAFEGIRFETEGTPIDEMFSELLARAADKERLSEAHPAFISVIKQISSDEAILISKIFNSNLRFHHVSSLNEEDGRFYFSHVEIDDVPKEQLQFPNRLEFYMNHLHAVGLAGRFEYRNQEPIFLGTPQLNSHQKQIGTRVFTHYRLTEFGMHFAQACLHRKN